LIIDLLSNGIEISVSVGNSDVDLVFRSVLGDCQVFGSGLGYHYVRHVVVQHLRTSGGDCL
jgi:hypothetical protein